MAGSFLRKLLGRTPPDTNRDVEEALGELSRVARERPALAAPVALLQELLPRLYEGPVIDKPPSLTSDTAAAKLASGIPLLRGEAFEVDVPSFRQRWRGACAAVQRHQQAEMGRALAEAMQRGQLDPEELVREVLAGRPKGVHARADVLGLDSGLTAAVLSLTLFPVLSHVSDTLLSLRQAIPWGHGYCPACGSWPLLGEFRGLEQTRFLRCGLCAAEWEFARLLCPFCGNRDHETLGYFAVEGEESRYRAATCAECRGYVKMLSTLTALDGPRLLVANVATLHLDLAAAERGYAVP